MDPIDLALLVLRAVFGVFLAAHGYNKVFGGGGLEGTARWFGSLGMRWPRVQARVAASTEIGAGLLFAVGLLTPFAAAGIIGVMVVAGWSAHRRNGFFIFRKGEGWEYVASIAVAAWCVAAIGPGEAQPGSRRRPRLDGAGTAGSARVIAGVLGVGGARRPARRVLPAGAAARHAVSGQRLADRADGGGRRLRRVLDLGAVLRLQGGGQPLRRPGVGRAGPGDLRGGDEQREALADLRPVDEDDPAMVAERGDLVDRATDVVEQMLDDVVAVAPQDDKGADLVPLWEADYRTHIEDRRRFAERLRTGDNVAFTETAVDGIPLSDKLEVFASDNEMPACAPPHDLSF